MKILDRYLLRCYAGPFGICLAAFTLLFIVGDLFNNLADFLGGGVGWRAILQYYVILWPTGLIYLMPVSLLLALLYSLGRLTRHNEITAMRACGLSTIRLLAPYIAVGVAATVFVGVVNEALAPWASWWAWRFVRAQRARNEDRIYIETHLPYRYHEGRREWLIERFDTRTGEMTGIRIEQYHPTEDRQLYTLRADTAYWMDGRWWLRNVVIQEYDEFGERKGPPRFDMVREMSDWAETPRLFMEELRDRQFRPVRGLLRFLENNRGISRMEVRRTWVDIHYRLALPFTCLVVMLIGLPFGHQTGRRGAFRGVIQALGLFFGYYVLIHVCVWLGKQGVLAPWLAGWFPNLLFLGWAAVLLARM